MARKMKDSGIEWIGEIPEGWEVVPVKRLCTMQAGKNLTSEQIAPEGTYPVYGGNGIRGFFSDYNCDGQFLTVGRQGALCGNVHKINGKVWATEHAVITTPSSYTILDFLYYLLIGMDLNQYVSSTAAQPGLAVGTLLNLKTCYPCSTLEQTQISNYLNAKCSEIDVMLSKTRSSIEEYKKLKQAVITQAVTKGVRGEREMKDSGVERIREIPEEWNKCKLKNISIDIGDGLHGTPKFDDSGEVYFINDNNFSSEYVEPKFDTKKLCLEESLNYPKPELTEQTIMISLNGSYGKVCLYRYFPMLLGKSAGYITLLPSINRRYVRYYLSSTPAQIIMTLSLNGTTIPNLSLNTLYNFPTILPPASEQAEIADYLDAKCTEIDGLIAKKEQLIKELESYKKSLIYEVVTGKREV